jgi:hypothetical protein
MLEQELNQMLEQELNQMLEQELNRMLSQMKYLQHLVLSQTETWQGHRFAYCRNVHIPCSTSMGKSFCVLDKNQNAQGADNRSI